MPIYETLDPTTIDLESIITLDLVSVSEAYARLVRFMESADTADTFRCDGGVMNALKRAAAKLTEAPKTKTKTVTYVQESHTVADRNVKRWRALRKGESAGNKPTKTSEVHDYTGEVLRQAVRDFGDLHGIKIGRAGTRSPIDREQGTFVAILSRNPVETSA